MLRTCSRQLPMPDIITVFGSSVELLLNASGGSFAVARAVEGAPGRGRAVGEAAGIMEHSRQEQEQSRAKTCHMLRLVGKVVLVGRGEHNPTG